MTQLVLILMSQTTSLVLFVAVIVAQIVTRSAMKKGNLRRARFAATVAFMTATLIILQLLVSYMFTRSTFSLIFGAIWCYFTWGYYKTLKSLPEK